MIENRKDIEKIKYSDPFDNGNAEDKKIALLTSHASYLEHGTSQKKTKDAYRELFKHHIPDYTIREIQDATSKAWVLGNDRFKAQIEKQTGRRASPLSRGGDRKSKGYRENQVL